YRPAMEPSTDRILTTHTGSLPRPNDLVELLYAADSGELADAQSFQRRVAEAVAASVQQQMEAGVDVVNDGEMGKIGYSTYIAWRHRRLSAESVLPLERGVPVRPGRCHEGGVRGHPPGGLPPPAGLPRLHRAERRRKPRPAAARFAGAR